MRNLIDIINESRKHLPGFGKRMKEAEALGLWEQAVGPMIAKHTRALKVQDEVLWIQVDHPIWKSELHHRKRQILEILNRVQPGGELSTLKDILFLDKR
jgi:predicted nucleic acid-binding Zn ribbon protein